jgi:ABC-type cobalt transport system substrate-binding protein
MNNQMTLLEFTRLVVDSLFFLTAFMGGVYIGYLLGYRDGNDNF